MLKFRLDAVYNNYVQPACLPSYENYEPTSDINAYIVGFGITSEGGELPTYLQNAVVTYYVSGAECANYDKLFRQSTEICAGNFF